MRHSHNILLLLIVYLFERMTGNSDTLGVGMLHDAPEDKD
jgi:hypothetical protein